MAGTKNMHHPAGEDGISKPLGCLFNGIFLLLHSLQYVFCVL
jgi:hypothetical protein